MKLGNTLQLQHCSMHARGKGGTAANLTRVAQVTAQVGHKCDPDVLHSNETMQWLLRR
jgi:hypothetical protein